MRSILVAKGLKHGFVQDGKQLKILNGLDLVVQQGENLAVLGPSGSGKSTFLGLLAGLDYPQEGSIEIQGTDITSLTPSELASFRGKFLGFVFQNYRLIPALSAQENVALPLTLQSHSEAEEKARQALELVGLRDRSEHLPSQLSGGECQRVAIARAWVTQPKLLFCDEPTGSLDRSTAEDISQLLFRKKEVPDQSMILVTHDIELAQKADRVLTLEKGKLIPWSPEGNHESQSISNS